MDAQQPNVATTTTGAAGTVTEGDKAKAVQAKPALSHDMHVKVYSPFKTYFDDRALSVSGVNDTGPFDILAGHRNFMTLVSACELIIRIEGQEDNKIKIARAVMHVKANEITVFLDV